MGKIYNIEATKSLVDFLAERFLDEYKSEPEKLSEILFLLPSRRACRELQEAFVRANGRVPTILPSIRAILDTEKEEIYFNNSELSLNINPSINPLHRSLIFTKLIMTKPKEWGLGDICTAQAYALAQNLSDLIDLVYENECNFSDLKNIVCEEYAEHWQQILQLLTIITHHWPKILEEEHSTDTVKNQIDLLYKQIKIWENDCPYEKIIIAGTTAGFPVLKKLVKTVSKLENGEVYLYGLDTYLNDEDWAKIDENHPQFELKELLDDLKLKRYDIPTLGCTNITPKHRFISEIMRPASATAEWQKIVHNKFKESDFNYLKVLNCDDLRQEAFAIALIMRETLETPEKTAALITPDRNLARRVVSELKRWNIIADDSSGQPLHLTALGIYLRLIIDVLEQNFSKTSLIALLKHPFTKCGMPADKYKIMIYHIEQKWRKAKLTEALNDEEEALLSFVYTNLKTLNDLYFAPTLNFSQMLHEHIKIAEKLADTNEKTGDKIIWRKEDGIAMAKFISELVLHTDIIGNIPSNDYSTLFVRLLSEQTVRVKFGQHPRIKILGPIEARLQKFDVPIIGEANEGKWPQALKADMWMSRPMKTKFEMPLPERSIGISANDFSHLLFGDKVYITRAEKDGGTPTSKSRWLLRLETVLAANFADLPQKEIKQAYSFIYDKKYTLWAKNLERSDAEEIAANKLSAPAPKPPLYARPRKLSAGKFADWIKDPYIIYARYILKLYPLDELDKPLGALDYGNLIHEVLCEFNNKYPSAYPPVNQAIKEMTDIADRIMEEWEIPPETTAFWKPNISDAFNWIAEEERKHRDNISLLHNEIKGKTTYELKGGNFTVEAKADRIEDTSDGKLNIIDYKTGSSIPSKANVKKGIEPQLSVEALIAENGGFPDLENKAINTLSYWKINDGIVELNEQETAESLQNTQKRIINLIEDFDDENTPYYSHPNPLHKSGNTDYEHLSRFFEWSVKDMESAENDENED